MFEWLVMLFGLSYYFYTYEEYVLKPILDKIVYLGDIFIFRKFHYEHVMCEKKILDVVCQGRLLLNMSKYELDKTSLMFLGPNIAEGEMKLDLFKIDAIMVWLTLKTRGFIGVAQF